MTARQPYPPVPPELRDLVRDVVERRGMHGASSVLGISRSTIAAILAELGVSHGTIAILRLAAQRRDVAA